MEKKILFPFLALHDYVAEAGQADGHYFWQDLIAAQWVFKLNPISILDIGSRIDGFIAHVASFRRIELADIRPVVTEIPNVSHLQLDMMNAHSLEKKYSLVTSLHAVEHFGLGRYGDRLDSEGHLKGLINIAELVANNGVLIISAPIGQSKVQFNSQRILDPQLIPKTLKNFAVIEFNVIPWKGPPNMDVDLDTFATSEKGLCGIYIMRKEGTSG